MTGHNDHFVMTGHYYSEPHKTKIRLRVPQDKSQTRFKSDNTQYCFAMTGHNDSFVIIGHNYSFVMTNHNDCFVITGHNDFLVMTGHNDFLVITGHNDPESHKTQVRLRIPQDSSETRFKSNKTQYFYDGKCTYVIVVRKLSGYLIA